MSKSSGSSDESTHIDHTHYKYCCRCHRRLLASERAHEVRDSLRKKFEVRSQQRFKNSLEVKAESSFEICIDGRDPVSYDEVLEQLIKEEEDEKQRIAQRKERRQQRKKENKMKRKELKGSKEQKPLATKYANGLCDPREKALNASSRDAAENGSLENDTNSDLDQDSDHVLNEVKKKGAAIQLPPKKTEADFKSESDRNRGQTAMSLEEGRKGQTISSKSESSLASTQSKQHDANIGSASLGKSSVLSGILPAPESPQKVAMTSPTAPSTPTKLSHLNLNSNTNLGPSKTDKLLSKPQLSSTSSAISTTPSTKASVVVPTTKSSSNPVASSTTPDAKRRGACRASDVATPSLWLGNMDPEADEDELRTLFARYGSVESVRVLRHAECAFVNFFRIADASRALEALQGAAFGHSRLQIQYQLPRDIRQQGKTASIAPKPPPASLKPLATTLTSTPTPTPTPAPTPAQSAAAKGPPQPVPSGAPGQTTKCTPPSTAPAGHATPPSSPATRILTKSKVNAWQVPVPMLAAPPATLLAGASAKPAIMPAVPAVPEPTTRPPQSTETEKAIEASRDPPSAASPPSDPLPAEDQPHPHDLPATQPSPDPLPAGKAQVSTSLPVDKSVSSPLPAVNQERRSRLADWIGSDRFNDKNEDGEGVVTLADDLSGQPNCPSRPFPTGASAPYRPPNLHGNVQPQPQRTLQFQQRPPPPFLPHLHANLDANSLFSESFMSRHTWPVAVPAPPVADLGRGDSQSQPTPVVALSNPAAQISQSWLDIGRLVTALPLSASARGVTPASDSAGPFHYSQSQPPPTAEDGAAPTPTRTPPSDQPPPSFYYSLPQPAGPSPPTNQMHHSLSFPSLRPSAASSGPSAAPAQTDWSHPPPHHQHHHHHAHPPFTQLLRHSDSDPGAAPDRGPAPAAFPFAHPPNPAPAAAPAPALTPTQGASAPYRPPGSGPASASSRTPADQTPFTGPANQERPVAVAVAVASTNAPVTTPTSTLQPGPKTDPRGQSVASAGAAVVRPPATWQALGSGAQTGSSHGIGPLRWEQTQTVGALLGQNSV